MLHCLYHLILDFQTLIVGALGFAGVIYTLRANSTASRKQHERVVNHECEVLKTALRAELIHIQGAYSDNF